MYKYSLRRELLRSPFIRILLAFVLGIISPNLAYNTPIVCVCFLILYSILLIFSFHISFKQKYQLRLIFGLTVFVIFFLLGICLDTYNKQKIFFEHESQSIYAEALYTGEIKKGTSYQQLNLKIIKYRYKDIWYKSSFNVLAYIPKQSILDSLKPGYHLLMKTQINSISDNTNPFSFNYAQYLRHRYIAYSCFVKTDDIIVLPTKSFSINYYLSVLRNKIKLTYEKAGLTGDVKHIMLALSIGQKHDLSQVLKTRWVDAGAIHVLAVSGLHVGLIYVILNFVLKIFNRYPFLKAFIILLLLCFYALLTGLSPSVCRATFMFSFIIIGRSISRQGNVYNSLAASAFFMLLVDTNLITDLGFQLSYSAVLSIVFFYPRLSRLVIVKSKFVNKIYQFIILSLSAQILSFPLLIYYFKQYPSYSILSNFVVIPLALLLIYSSIFLILFSHVKVISIIIVYFVDHIYYYSNMALKFIVEMPGAVIRNILINQYQLILLYGIIFFAINIFVLKRRTSFQYILFFILLFQIENIRVHFSVPKDEIISFETGKNTLLALKSGDTMLVIHNFNINRDYMGKTLDPYILNRKVKNITYYTPTENIIFTLKNKSLLYMIEDFNQINSLKQIEIHTIVLSNNMKCEPLKIKCFKNLERYIITGGFYTENETWLSHQKKAENIIYSSKHESQTFLW